jgi:hypothetical protein
MGTWPELHAGTNFNYVWDTDTLSWIREEPSGTFTGDVTIVDGTAAGKADVVGSAPSGTEQGLVVRNIPSGEQATDFSYTNNDTTASIGQIGLVGGWDNTTPNPRPRYLRMTPQSAGHVSIRSAGTGVELGVAGDPFVVAEEYDFGNNSQNISTNGGQVNFTASGRYGSALINVFGTWVGTLQVRLNVQSGGETPATQVINVATGASQTSITANGTYEVPMAGVYQMSVVATAWTSGTASIVARFSSRSTNTVRVANLPTTQAVTAAALSLTQGSSSTSATGPMVQGEVTAATPSHSNATIQPLSLTTTGNLRVTDATSQTLLGHVARWGAGDGVTQFASGLQSASGTFGSLNLYTFTTTTLFNHQTLYTLEIVDSGAWTATIQVQALLNTAVVNLPVFNYSTLTWQMGITAAGTYAVPVSGFATVRANVTSYTSGSFGWAASLTTGQSLPSAGLGITNDELRASPISTLLYATDVDLGIDTDLKSSFASPSYAQTGLITRPIPFSAAAASVTGVTSSASNQTALFANDARFGACFYNDADKACYLKLGTTASTSSFTVKIAAGSYYELPATPIYTGQVDVIWDASPTGNLLVTEIS